MLCDSLSMCFLKPDSSQKLFWFGDDRSESSRLLNVSMHVTNHHTTIIKYLPSINDVAEV